MDDSSEMITINIMNAGASTNKWDDPQIATIQIEYDSIKRYFDGHMKPQWVYAYGAPLDTNIGDQLNESAVNAAKRMNRGVMEGTTFRGKLLVKCKVEEKEVKQTKRVIHDINDLEDDERPKMIEYYLRADLFDHKMSVMVAVNDVVATSKALKVDDDDNSFESYQSLMSDRDGNPNQRIVPFVSDSDDDDNDHRHHQCIVPLEVPEGWKSDPKPVILPDVFIYLCTEKAIVSYRRVPLNQIISESADDDMLKGKLKMKRNPILEAYGRGYFPETLDIALSCGPTFDISKERKWSTFGSLRSVLWDNTIGNGASPKGLVVNKKVRKCSSNNSSILKQILKPQKLCLRLYILSGTKLIPRDFDGLSDPYLVIKIGTEQRSTRNDHLSNTLEPEFYYGVEIPVLMPGASKLEIEVWDWDGIGDDLIGRTTIDIEDRWYSKNWRDLRLKPVETRTLRSDQSTISHGKLKMWMEMMTPHEAKKYPIIDIRPPPMQPHELRVIIWECKDCPFMDELEQMNDLFITAELETTVAEEANHQQTDLHFRSTNGKGSFNWRMKFPIALPKQKDSEYPRLKLQIWDKDFFTPHDIISEGSISLKPFLRYCEKDSKDKRCVLMKHKKRIFWLDMNKNGKKGGQIRLSVELLPDKVAKRFPAGFGRESPNRNPFLPPPDGRAEFSILNPFNSVRLLIGDKLCLKMVGLFCVLFCVAFVIFIAPNLVSAVAADLVTGK